jgi:hypothetical protein
MPDSSGERSFQLTRTGQAVVVARSAPKQHWIVIEMVGEDDSPVKNEAYRITLPDGSIKEGKTDDKGQATIEAISMPGICIVRFPDLDSEAFETV